MIDKILHKGGVAQNDSNLPPLNAKVGDKIVVSQLAVTEETVTISKKQYDQLVEDQKLLRALEAGGVDNWEWYGEALNSLEQSESGDGE